MPQSVIELHVPLLLKLTEELKWGDNYLDRLNLQTCELEIPSHFSIQMVLR